MVNFLSNILAGFIGSAIFAFMLFIVSKTYKFFRSKFNYYESSYNFLLHEIELYKNENRRNKIIKKNFGEILFIFICISLGFMLITWSIVTGQIDLLIKSKLIKDIFLGVMGILFLGSSSFLIGISMAQKELLSLDKVHIIKIINKRLKKYRKKNDEKKTEPLLAYLQELEKLK